MGASRKLQGEIDRVLKKVQEGVDVFDSIWNKVHDTDNANQKEKFEADLKKEIKKLQRYRDQIKTWIQSSEIKDKKVSASYEQALVDARKLIEREMERFKICEKETKTKAFSKEGLGQQPKTDPKEKAKAETRDWLNNVVGELETQIDIFEAEIEGLSVKKGKTRPPRLTHLETSITRHKAHIMKLELILRLLDNDELSPEQVGEAKDFLDDYVDRNQEDFDEFSDIDELYSVLPLDKVESLEDLVTIGPPGLLKGTPILSTKTTSASTPSQITGTNATAHQQSTSSQEHSEETQDTSSDIPTGASPAKSTAIGSAASTPNGGHAAALSSSNAPHNTSGAPVILSYIPPVRGFLETAGGNASSTASLSSSMKEDEISAFPGRRPSPSLADAAVIRGMGRGAISNQTSASAPMTAVGVLSSNGTLGGVPSASDIAKRNIVGADDRLGSSAMVQPLVSPLGGRMILPQGVKANDGNALPDSGNSGDNSAITGRVFSPPVISGMQWRPGSSFGQNEAGQLRGRAEIVPDIREKYLQRLQQGPSNLLGMPLGGGKQFSTQQQNPLLQQFNSQSSSLSPQGGLGLGLQAPVLTSLQQAPTSQHPQFGQQPVVSTALNDSETQVEQAEDQQEEQSLPDDSTIESTSRSGTSKANEDDLKSPNALDAPAGSSGSFVDPSQVTRDVDLSPGQPLQSAQPSGSLGVIGRRSVSDLGAVGENISGLPNVTAGSMHDQMYNMQMLEAAYHKLPQSRDSERARIYTPKHPAVTPPSFPQTQAPLVNNPLYWERLGVDHYGADTLFFAFYYQQNTYQQYLAAKELKKQSWRYHKKYNTWFQRHEEPKVATDEFEQGTYVYFDFHIAGEDMHHGWCQRIKTDFTFEYNYLEDDLIV